VELQTGCKREHRQEDLLTRAVTVDFDERARCPRWERFLAEVLPDASTVAFFQRAIGYSLTGLVSEHCLFFLHGVGANGKSTAMGVLLEMLGPFATQAPSEILLARRGEAHPTELTQLYGRRLVACQEIDESRRWAEAQVKHMTGGDRIVARRMREDFWEFEPTHKLWIAANHKPVVRGTDEGIWRRLRLIPFERVIPVADRDPHLGEALRAELPGILAWSVAGCLAWQREGLAAPSAVTDATAAYRADSDRIGPFIDEFCFLDPAGRVSRADLYAGYQEWAGRDGDANPLGSREFAARVRERGITETRVRAGTGPVRGWAGIKLRSHVVSPEHTDPYYAHTGARTDVNHKQATTADYVTTREVGDDDDDERSTWGPEVPS
jgi:putative DNA primase/helicase